MNFVHFADDSTVFASGSSLPSLANYVNTELVKVDNWLCANKLSLHILKSSFSVFSGRALADVPVIKIRGQDLAYVHSVKFLGIQIDDRLAFSDHIAVVCGKVSRSLAVMRKLSDLVPASVMRNLYLCLVYPYIIYGVEVWGASCKTKMRRLRSLMDRCVSLTDRGSSSSDGMYAQLHLMNFDQVYRYFCLIRIYKYINVEQSGHFGSQLMNYGVSHDVGTRFNHNNNYNLLLFAPLNIFLLL